MHPLLTQHRSGLAELCRRYGVRRLDASGSAVRAGDFDPSRSDVDVLVEFGAEADDLGAFLDFKEALEALLGRPVDLVERHKPWRRAATPSAAIASSAKPSRTMPPDPAERDTALVLDMALAAQDAIGFVADVDEAAFLTSRLHQSAVIHSLAVIGKAAGKVSPDLRAAHPEIPWRDITGMRHRLIHGYAEVRLDVVWAMVTGRLPALLEVLAAVPACRRRHLGSTRLRSQEVRHGMGCKLGRRLCASCCHLYCRCGRRARLSDGKVG